MNLQEYKRIDISKDEILPLAERMKKEGRYLVMIHGLINKDGQPDVSWDYAVDPVVESYHVVGETSFPSIGEIYCEAATCSVSPLKAWMFPNGSSCRRTCSRPRARVRSWSLR